MPSIWNKAPKAKPAPAKPATPAAPCKKGKCSDKPKKAK